VDTRVSQLPFSALGLLSCHSPEGGPLCDMSAGWITDELLLMHPLASPPQSLSQAAHLRVARLMSPTPVQPSRGPRVYRACGSSMDPALAASSSFVPEQDVIMEEVVSPDLSFERSEGSGGTSTPVTQRASAAKEVAASQLLAGLQPSAADLAVHTLVDKIKSSVSVASISAGIPVDFRMTVVDFIKKYHANVVRLGAVATHLAKLRQHKSNGTYPTALHSIREPKIQWSREFMAVPQSSWNNFGSTARSFSGFSETVGTSVSTLKNKVLDQWITEKVKELSLFQVAAAADSGVSMLQDALEEHMSDLRSRYTYDSAGGRPRAVIPPQIHKIIGGRVFQHKVLFRATPVIISKINSIVHNAEDHRLSDALKRMEISVDAPCSAAEMPKNDVAVLAKKIAELMKKLNGKGKVSETISPFILCSASLLSVSRSTLANFCSVFIAAAIEEADEGEEEEFFKYKEQEKADPPTAPEKDRLCCQICKEEARWEVETWSEKGFWEEEWQEIGLACDRLDSFLGLSCTNISCFRNECTSCALRSFLLTFLPFSSVVNVSLRSHIQVCIYFFQVHVLSSCRLNIFDYNTYPLIMTYMPHEIALFFLTFSAPNWLLGS